MTSDQYEDLGSRLDDLAAAEMARIELTNPASLPQPKSRRRFGKGAAILVANAAIIVLIVVFALWGRSSGPEVSEISDTVLEDLLPEWAAVPAGVDVDGWLDQSELSTLFDIATVRQIDFEPGAVFVGLDPGGRNVVVAVGSRLDGEVLDSSLISLPDLFREKGVVVESRRLLQVTTVGGIAPISAVAVLVDGERVGLRAGTFYVELPVDSEFPRIEFELANGSIVRPTQGSGPGAPGGSAAVSARVEGSNLEWSLPSVNCARMRSDLAVFEFSAIGMFSPTTGDPQTSSFLPGEGLLLELRADVLILLGQVGGEAPAAFVPIEDLIIDADVSGTVGVSWDTETTSGRATIDCGDFIVDAAELRSLLRAGPVRAEVLPEWADVPVGFSTEDLHEGFDPAVHFDVSTVRQIDFDSIVFLVGVSADGQSIAIGQGDISGFGGTSGSSLASLLVLDWASVVTSNYPGLTTVAGVAPRGVVKVTVDGQAAELRSGAFVATFDSDLESPESPDIEVEFSDGTVQKLGRTAVQVGATTLEATIDGVAVQYRPDRVACTYTGRDPATIEVRTLSGFLDTESLAVADLVDGELQLNGFNSGDFFGASIASEDLSVRISDSLREVSISWDTDESTGSMFVDCGSTLYDTRDLVELLRN